MRAPRRRPPIRPPSLLAVLLVLPLVACEADEVVLTCSQQYDFEDRTDTGRYAEETLSCERYLEGGSDVQSSLRAECEHEGNEQGARLAFCDCAFDVPESCQERFGAR